MGLQSRHHAQLHAPGEGGGDWRGSGQEEEIQGGQCRLVCVWGALISSSSAESVKGGKKEPEGTSPVLPKPRADELYSDCNPHFPR